MLKLWQVGVAMVSVQGVASAQGNFATEDANQVAMLFATMADAGPYVLFDGTVFEQHGLTMSTRIVYGAWTNEALPKFQAWDAPSPGYRLSAPRPAYMIVADGTQVTLISAGGNVERKVGYKDSASLVSAVMAVSDQTNFRYIADAFTRAVKAKGTAYIDCSGQVPMKKILNDGIDLSEGKGSPNERSYSLVGVPLKFVNVFRTSLDGRLKVGIEFKYPNSLPSSITFAMP